MTCYAVCFVKTGKSFLPEVYAYSDYLSKHNISNIICETETDAGEINASLYYRFGGLLSHKIKTDVPEIHEYHTLSTGKWPYLKNMLKSVLSVRPVYYSFLNKQVEQGYFFSRALPRFYRDMGADASLLAIRQHTGEKKYDICYFGSISNRSGIVATLLQLAELGYQVVVGGSALEADIVKFKQCANLTYVGLCDRSQVASYYSQTRYGLNYVAAEYPLTKQTSTKVIEYLVAGLPIISNAYEWIDQHASEHGYRYVNLTDVLSGLRFGDSRPQAELILAYDNAMMFTWDAILTACDFDGMITKLVGR